MDLDGCLWGGRGKEGWGIGQIEKGNQGPHGTGKKEDNRGMSHRALGEQLAMFYTPRQIKERWEILPEDRANAADDMRYNDEGSDRDYQQDPPTDDEFWDHRRDENDYRAPDFESNIRNDGVHIPVTLGQQFIQDGHHRIAAARDDQLIPAVHTENRRDIGNTSPTLFHADGYRYPAPNDDDSDFEYDPESPFHRLVGRSAG